MRNLERKFWAKILGGIFAFLAIFGGFSEILASPRPSGEDLNACFEKSKDTQFIYKNHTAIALTKDLAAVIYDPNNKLDSRDYIKFDPYLGLYLVRLDRVLNTTFMMNELDSKPGAWVNVLDQNVSQIGHISHFGENLGDFDRLSYESDRAGMLLCDCCAMLGIALGGDKFIGNRYIKHFLKFDDVYWGDIGVTFYDINGTIRVKSSNAFSVGKELLSGDRIIRVNDEIPANLRELNEKILFAPKGASFKFEIQREDRNATIIVQNAFLPQSKSSQNVNSVGEFNATATPKPKITTKRAPASFLPKYGLTLNKNLIVTKVAPHSKAAVAGFSVGDKILTIDKQSVRSVAAVEQILRSKDGKFYFLISRDDFQFFIRVYK